MEIHLQCYIIGAWQKKLKRKRLHQAPRRWLQAQQCGWKGTETAVSHRCGVTSERGYQLVSLSPPSRVSEGVAAWFLLVAFSMQAWQPWRCPGLTSPAGGKGKPGDTWGRASPILTQKDDLALATFCCFFSPVWEPCPPGGQGREGKAQGSSCCWKICYLNWPNVMAVRGIAGYPQCREKSRHSDWLFSGACPSSLTRSCSTCLARAPCTCQTSQQLQTLTACVENYRPATPLCFLLA